MYLKSLQITNFRKFGTTENIIEFVDSKDNLQQDINIALPTTLIVGKNNSGKTTITKALETLKSGPFRILCQLGKIKNTKGHKYENRNRCRAIC